LWRELEFLPRIPTRALVTDVGNDIMYGFSAEQVLIWVRETLCRLQRTTQDVILTDLPLESIQRLSGLRFLLFRSILFPSCRLSLDQVLQTVERINAGLVDLSAAFGARLFKLNPAWYGIDPIHIRRPLWRSAWQEILDAGCAAYRKDRSLLEGLRLYFMAPERRWICTVEQFTPQSGIALPSGGRVWLY
jgi:hypothetical protein